MTISRRRNVFDVLEYIKENELTAKNILVRVDYNVPMTENSDGTYTIADDSRIRSSLQTIKAIISSNCNAILVSHMGRPKLVQKKLDDESTLLERRKLSLFPVSERLSQLLQIETMFTEDCVGPQVEIAVNALPKEGGKILLLENLRFYKEEEKNEENFAKQLASFADAYINDAFGTCHRAHASITGVPALLNKNLCGLGCLVSSEVSYLDFSSIDKGTTVAAIIGGSKVSTKLPVIEGLLNQVDILILGGGLAFTFIKASGIPIGKSLVEDTMIETAKDLLKFAKKNNKKIVLPKDAVCGRSFPNGPVPIEETKTFCLSDDGSGIEDEWSGFDVGPDTISLFRKELAGCTKVVFNGPMGVFEVEPYDQGTRGLVTVLEEITENGTITVVGGGDSVAALQAFNKSNAVTYISTGGGATLELLAGYELPGVTAISEV